MEQIAVECDCEFLHSGDHAAVSDVDGLHFDAAGHAALGEAIGRKVQEMQRTKIQC
jgi:hypothetical protein